MTAKCIIVGQKELVVEIVTTEKKVRVRWQAVMQRSEAQLKPEKKGTTILWDTKQTTTATRVRLRRREELQLRLQSIFFANRAGHLAIQRLVRMGQLRCCPGRLAKTTKQCNSRSWSVLLPLCEKRFLQPCEQPTHSFHVDLLRKKTSQRRCEKSLFGSTVNSLGFAHVRHFPPPQLGFFPDLAQI